MFKRPTVTKASDGIWHHVFAFCGTLELAKVCTQFYQLCLSKDLLKHCFIRGKYSDSCYVEHLRRSSCQPVMNVDWNHICSTLVQQIQNHCQNLVIDTYFCNDWHIFESQLLQFKKLRKLEFVYLPKPSRLLQNWMLGKLETVCLWNAQHSIDADKIHTNTTRLGWIRGPVQVISSTVTFLGYNLSGVDTRPFCFHLKKVLQQLPASVTQLAVLCDTFENIPSDQVQVLLLNFCPKHLKSLYLWFDDCSFWVKQEIRVTDTQTIRTWYNTKADSALQKDLESIALPVELFFVYDHNDKRFDPCQAFAGMIPNKKYLRKTVFVK